MNFMCGSRCVRKQAPPVPPLHPRAKEVVRQADKRNLLLAMALLSADQNRSNIMATTDDSRAHLLALTKGFSTAMLVTHDPDHMLAAHPMHGARVDDNGDVYFATRG